MKAVITLATLVAVTFGLPNVSYTVFGAAQMDARVGDTLRVSIDVADIDAGVSSLEITVPYPDAVQYKGIVADAALGGTLTGIDGDGQVVVSWTGALPPGESVHLGYVEFTVLKADRSVLGADGHNALAKDAAEFDLETTIETTGATVRLMPRPLRFLLDLAVVPHEEE
jgi:hypothetical protein